MAFFSKINVTIHFTAEIANIFGENSLNIVTLAPNSSTYVSRLSLRDTAMQLRSQRPLQAQGVAGHPG
jgi:hypothetical protein